MRLRRPASAAPPRARRSGTRSRRRRCPRYGSYPNPLPYAPCGYKPGAAAQRLRRRRARWPGRLRRSRRHGRHRRRLRLAVRSSTTRRPTRSATIRRTRFKKLAVLAEGLPAVLHGRPERVRRVGLVRRGDARRRGRARHGSRRQHPLRRRQELRRRRPHRRAQQRRRQRTWPTSSPTRTATPASRVPQADIANDRPDRHVQAAAQGIGVYFSSGDDGDEIARLRRPRPSADFPASDAARHRGRRDEPRRRRQRLRGFEQGWGTGKRLDPDRRRLGTRARRRLPLRRRRRHRAGCSPSPTTRRASSRTTLATATRRRRSAASCPTSRMVGDPNTGFLVGQTQTFPDGRSTTTSTGSAAPACRRRCSPA